MQKLLAFWKKHPALFYGASAYLGFSLFFYDFLKVALLVVVFWSPFFMYDGKKIVDHAIKKVMLSFFLISSCFIYAQVCFLLPVPPKEGIDGIAHLSVNSIRTKSGFLGKQWIYECELHAFFTKNCVERPIARSLKCSIVFADRQKSFLPETNTQFLMPGILKQNDSKAWLLKAFPRKWKVIGHKTNLVKERHEWKNAFCSAISRKFSQPVVSDFLTGLFIGEFEGDSLKTEFTRFGLQHILAISGFHFSIVAALLSIVLSTILPKKACCFLLLVFLTLYAIFLGFSPSIMRAFLMAIFGVLGKLLEKQPNALNLLGVALLGVLFFDPFSVYSIGFQFSFLATAGILLLYSPLSLVFEQILEKRELEEVLQMNKLNQYGYCILSFFRQGMALMLAVNLFVLPLILYYFEKVPFFSFFYNLFYPFLVSMAFCLFLISLCLSPFPLLSVFLFKFTEIYTNFILALVYGFPASLDLSLELAVLSSNILLIYLVLVFLFAIIVFMSTSEISRVKENCES